MVIQSYNEYNEMIRDLDRKFIKNGSRVSIKYNKLLPNLIDYTFIANHEDFFKEKDLLVKYNDTFWIKMKYIPLESNIYSIELIRHNKGEK